MGKFKLKKIKSDNKWVKYVLISIFSILDFVLILFLFKLSVNNAILSSINNKINTINGMMGEENCILLSSESETIVKALDYEESEKYFSTIRVIKDPVYIAIEETNNPSTYLIEENDKIYKYEYNVPDGRRLYGDYYEESSNFSVNNYIENLFQKQNSQISINNLEAIIYKKGDSYIIIQSFSSTVSLESESDEYNELITMFENHYNLKDLLHAKTTIIITPKEKSYTIDMKVNISTKYKNPLSSDIDVKIDINSKSIYSYDEISVTTPQQSSPTLLLGKNIDNPIVGTLNHNFYMNQDSNSGYAYLYLEKGIYNINYAGSSSYYYAFNSKYYMYEIYDNNKNLIISSSPLANSFIDYIFEVESGYYYIKFINCYDYQQSAKIHFEIDKLNYENVGEIITLETLPDKLEGYLEGSRDYLIYKYYSNEDQVLEFSKAGCDILYENSLGQFKALQKDRTVFQINLTKGVNYIIVITKNLETNYRKETKTYYSVTLLNLS